MKRLKIGEIQQAIRALLAARPAAVAPAAVPVAPAAQGAMMIGAALLGFSELAGGLLSNGNLYVMTQDNQIYALRQTDGEPQWNEAGPVAVSGIFGVGAPPAAASMKRLSIPLRLPVLSAKQRVTPVNLSTRGGKQ